jgi:hypothetical protein
MYWGASGWSREYHSSDHLGTTRRSTRANVSVALRFNGTAVWIYGRTGPSYGDYTVKLDTRPEHSATARAGVAGEGDGGIRYNQLLYAATDLSRFGDHVVNLTARGNETVYMDYMVLQQSR